MTLTVGVAVPAGSRELPQNTWTWLYGRVKVLLSEPGKLIVLTIALLILVGLIIYPMALLARFGLADKNGLPTWAPVVEAFSDPGIIKALWNTLQLGVLVTLGTLVVGLPLAWLVTRTDIPFKNLIRVGAAISFVVPSFITVIAWIFLAAPNTGYLNIALGSVLGLDAPVFNIMSFSGLVFVEIAHLYPLVFFAVASALANVDPSYEHAACVLGASKWRTVATVTIPLVRPAIVSGCILVILDAVSSFGAPAAIGMMANFSVLTTKIYTLLSFPPHLELSAAISLPVVIFTLLCLLVQRSIVKGNRYRTISGKSRSAEPVRLGKAKYPALIFCMTVFFVTSVLPLFALLVLSMLNAFGSDVTLENMTLEHFRSIIDPSFGVLDAVYHSLLLSAGTAFACILLGVLFAWFVERTQIVGRGIVTATILTAYGFPAIALAVGIMLGYLNWLYGTFSILLIAYVSKNLPISFVLFRTALKQITPDLEEAARVCGAGWLRTLGHVTLPLLKVSGLAAGLLVFALSLRELSMSAILTQPATEVMSTKVLEYLEQGTVELAAAMALLIVVLSLAAMILSRLVAGKSALEVK
ncbi:MAG: iron ABC transporter permease [Rhizobiaceae bacterium]|nr:iron ABC transporter permease [Rhizobiaceae bacterium]